MSYMKYIPLVAVLIVSLYYEYWVRLLQLVRIGSHDHLQHLVCPAPVLRESLSAAVQTCPSSSQGCILPPQVPQHSVATGVTFGDILEEDDVVLEIGSRYGAVSCALSEVMGNNGKLVTVEADPDVWAMHQYNKLSHSCTSYSVFGVLGEEDMTVLRDTQGYGKRTSAGDDAEGVTVKHFTWDEVEQETGLTFNTLIIDCEGCIVNIIDTYRHKFRQVKKIIL